MFKDLFIYLMTEHRRKFLGTVIGLILAIMFLTFGFWRTFAAIALVGIGYLIGKQLDNGHDLKGSLQNLFRKR